jgi:hypothetical protein
MPHFARTQQRRLPSLGVSGVIPRFVARVGMLPGGGWIGIRRPALWPNRGNAAIPLDI